MPCSNLIRIEVPPHLREGIHSERALHLLRESVKRNLRNIDHIDHITIKDMKNLDGTICLFTVVIAKPLPVGCHGSLACWAVRGTSARHRYYTD
jgi:hypothetical protein